MNKFKKMGMAILGSLLGGISGNSESFAGKDMSCVIDNIRVILWQDVNDIQIREKARKWQDAISADGSWVDINYQDKSRAPWSPQQHLDRVLDMSFAYMGKYSEGRGDLYLGGAITSALKCWIDRSPVCANWWYNEISVPQTIGKILILLNGAECLDKRLQKQLILCMKKGDIKKQEGANKTDIAIHYIFRAALTGNDTLMKETTNEAFSILSLGKREGIQIDNSYHQHEDQLYISGYGDVLIDGVLSIASYLKGTDYNLSKKQLDLLSDFVMEGYGSIFRSVYKDYNAGGRLLSRKNALRNNIFVKQLELLAVLDAVNKKKYQELIQEIESVSNVRNEYNRLFWRSDYMVHNRHSYQASVRGASTRCYKAETGGNGENLKGTLLSAGSFSIRVSGDEYFDIFPCWDWAKIPGVTSLNQVPPYTKEWGEYGKTAFVGGVSDKRVGIFTIQYKEYGVKAHKGYFFFDDEIVCLGAGINGDNPGAEVITSVNQCLYRGEILRGQDNKDTLNSGIIQDMSFVYHDHVGYYFMDSSKVKLQVDTRQESWRGINQTQSQDLVTQKIFSLYIDHGKNIRDAKYSYMIIPGLTGNTFKSYTNNHIEVIRNNVLEQAVVNTKTHTLQIVFYEAGELNYRGFKVSVNIPCVVLIPNYEQPGKIYIGDPSQKEDLLLIHLNEKVYKVGLPQGDLRGSTVSVCI